MRRQLRKLASYQPHDVSMPDKQLNRRPLVMKRLDVVKLYLPSFI